jgi:hypothetical protein
MFWLYGITKKLNVHCGHPLKNIQISCNDDMIRVGNHWNFLKMYSQDDFKLKYNIGPLTSKNILHYIIKMLSKLWTWQIFLFLPSSYFFPILCLEK